MITANMEVMWKNVLSSIDNQLMETEIDRGYYTVARRYEFYFRVAKQSFTNERSEWVKYCFCHKEENDTPFKIELNTKTGRILVYSVKSLVF